jgi:tetratricopeptide (TPR) repeat protein
MVRSGRADAAIPYLEQALAIRRDTLGPSHHNVTWTLLQLAAAYREGGDVERARGLYERVIALSHERGTILQHADAATDALTEIEASSPAGAP